jgi:DNA replication and repair protein RecF
MEISKLFLDHFRTYSRLECEFTKPVTVFVGKNSSGKTNILEAIELLSRGKSFRGSSDHDMISHKEDFYRVSGTVGEADEQHNLDIRYVRTTGKTGKELRIDGVRRPLIEVVSILKTVLFVPQDTNTFISSPHVRRQLLDILLCKISSSYCITLGEYQKIIKHRNKLLARINERHAHIDELEYWDEQLSAKASVLWKARAHVVQYMNARISDRYNDLASTHQMILMKYHTSIGGDLDALQGNTNEELSDALVAHRDREIAYRTSIIGPHRDDFSLMVENHNIAEFGSRGDQRTAILALKLIQKEYIEEMTGERPVVILDDVYSELDSRRRKKLTEMLLDSQVFISTTDLAHIDEDIKQAADIMMVKKGTLIRNVEARV